MTVGVIWLLGCMLLASPAAQRPLPRPLAHHPGNIFLAGENVAISVPDSATRQWTLTDVSGAKVASGDVTGEKADLDKLGVGFYRVTWSPPTNPVDTALAVLQPLVASTPADSPICLQTWLSGYYILGKIASVDDAANIVALSGVNGVRDAVAWTWLCADDGAWIDSGNRSVDSLPLITKAYVHAGLKLLLMTEPATPLPYQLPADWGARPRKKFPADYRDYAAYARHLVEKAGPDVDAYEAWNEPEGIGGGLIGSETATAMKVFRLAARSVEPSAHCSMGIGIPHAESLYRNDYVDAVDSYHYHAHKSPELIQKRRHTLEGLTGDRPVWMTEASYGSYPLADRKRRRMSTEVEARQAADIAKLFARGLHDGNDRLYYFCLFDFTEEAGQVWGIIMPETLEPRPAYVALAAAGRLLAGARPLGAIQQLPEGVEGWLVESVIDGVKKKVAVLWKNDSSPAPCPALATESAWDVWGRKLPRVPKTVGSMPLYLVLNPDATVSVTPLSMRKVLTTIRPLDISPVVADFRRPDRFKSRIGDFFLLTHLDNTLDLDVYNFSSSEQKGVWSVESTDGVVAKIPVPSQTLAAGARASLRLQVRGNPSQADGRVYWIQVTGRFGDGLPSRLTLPVVFCPEEFTPKKQRSVIVTGSNAAWQSVTPSGTQATIEASADWTSMMVRLGEAPNKTVGTTWATGLCPLKPEEQIPPTAKAVTLRLRAGMLPTGAQLSLNLIERSGAAYACALPVDEKSISSSQGQRFTLPFALFVFQAYRKPYVDEALNLDEVVACEISISAMPHEQARLEIGELGWVLE